MHSEYAYIAMNRFLYGTDNKSFDALQSKSSLPQVKQWLISQLFEYKLDKNQWNSKKAIVGYYHFKQAQKQDEKMMQSDASTSKPQSKTIREELLKSTINLAEQTALANINHQQALQSRLLDFFSNHFSVTRQNFAMTLLAPTLEVEAIAPNLHLKFSDMLKAVIQHPAMLLYLNNEQSSGPNSPLVTRQKRNNKSPLRGLNENLAREILELHTLGVNGGYAQQDIIELAKAISGWSIGNAKREEPPEFKFRAFIHEPGTRTILAKRYPQTKSRLKHQQGLEVLNDLALHPATASHVCYKLAKHFIADKPNKSIVTSMTQAWLDTDGDIPSVITSMINHDESWSPTLQKFKTPREFVISACRACDHTTLRPELYRTLVILGQGLFDAGSPAGYPDAQNAWLGVSALNSRIEWADHFAGIVTKRKATNLDVIALANRVLGPFLGDDTLQAIKQAESKQQALALFLMSPEFQRR